jgi:hypothetical protein
MLSLTISVGGDSVKTDDQPTYEKIMQWVDTAQNTEDNSDSTWRDDERNRYIYRRYLIDDDLQPTYYASPWKHSMIAA